MLHLVNQRYDIITTTPDRSVPSSPSLSPAVVTHTIATSSKPQRNSWGENSSSSSSVVDLAELSKLLQAKSTSSTSSNTSNITAPLPPPPAPAPPVSVSAINSNPQQQQKRPSYKQSSSNSTRPRSQLFQSSKPPSPTLSTSSAEPTFYTNFNAAATPILLQNTTSSSVAAQAAQKQAQQQQQVRPILSHRPASTCSTPSQFVFKKPEYDERYHQTHFHRQSSSSSSLLYSNNDKTNGNNKDLFLAWSDLRRFFVNSPQPVSPTSPTGSTHSQEQQDNNKPIAKSETFANQFRQDIGGRYGTWGEWGLLETILTEIKKKLKKNFYYLQEDILEKELVDR